MKHSNRWLEEKVDRARHILNHGVSGAVSTLERIANNVSIVDENLGLELFRVARKIKVGKADALSELYDILPPKNIRDVVK